MAVMSIVFIIEGFAIAFFPKWSRKTKMKIFSNLRNLRITGFIEILVGIVLLIISISFS